MTQSNLHPISGKLPNGFAYSAQVRVIRPHALVMLKLLALADRYANIRGPKEARHDREEAQTHAADIVAIVTAIPDIPQFNNLFAEQFAPEPFLGVRLLRSLADFFRDITSPGLLVYTEYLAASLPTDRATPELLRQQTDLGRRIVAQILPPPEFLALAAAVDDTTVVEIGAPLVDEFLSALENARIPVSDALALQSLPSSAFGGAYQPGAAFVVSAAEPLQKLSAPHHALLRSYLHAKVDAFRTNEELRRRFPHTLKD